MWTRHVVLPKRKIYPLCYSYRHLVDSISSLCYYIWIFCAPVALPFKMLYIFLHGRSSEFKKCWRTKLMCNRILYTLILHKYNPTWAGDSLQLATILQNIKKKKFCLMMWKISETYNCSNTVISLWSPVYWQYISQAIHDIVFLFTINCWFNSIDSCSVNIYGKIKTRWQQSS